MRGFLLIVATAVLIAAPGCRKKADQDKLSDAQVANATTAAADKPDRPDKNCGTQATYDSIKRELFRQAADTRGRDGATYDRLAAYATLIVDQPRLTGRDVDIGGVRCAAQLKLVLPPGVAVTGGRRQLESEADYRVQPAADGNGNAVTLGGVDAIIVPLATLTKTGSVPAARPALAPTSPSYNAPPPPSAAPQPAPSPPQQVSANPSFNCRFARTRGELAVCASPGLAALDRQMTAHYVGALGIAEVDRRAVLRSTRDSFLAYRDRCSTDACIIDAYRGRMREIDDIMAGRWIP
ncbi:MAG: hypothetical protein ABIR51_00515, partial [Sphingomicrobium sp.]